jgi:hypothetical protein
VSAGEEISYGDSALFPTFVFMTYILPKHFSWQSVFTRRPKLEVWWKKVNEDPDASRVINEILPALQAWETSGRWDNLGISKQASRNSR